MTEALARLAASAMFLGTQQSIGTISETHPLSVALAGGITVEARCVADDDCGGIVVTVAGNPTSSRKSVRVTVSLDAPHGSPVMLVGDGWARTPSSFGGHNFPCGNRYDRLGPRLMLSAAVPLEGAAASHEYRWTACDIADIDGDGVVGGDDLAELLSRWERHDTCCDIDGDGIVDGADLTIMLGRWTIL